MEKFHGSFSTLAIFVVGGGGFFSGDYFKTHSLKLLHHVSRATSTPSSPTRPRPIKTIFPCASSSSSFASFSIGWLFVVEAETGRSKISKTSRTAWMYFTEEESRRWIRPLRRWISKVGMHGDKGVDEEEEEGGKGRVEVQRIERSQESR